MRHSVAVSCLPALLARGLKDFDLVVGVDGELPELLPGEARLSRSVLMDHQRGNRRESMPKCTMAYKVCGMKRLWLL